MKNERIVRAYDSINPTPQEKERMLRNILAEADLEKPVRKAKKKEPVVYTARATKTNPVSLIATVAACVAVVAGSVFLLSKTGGMKPSQPVYASPSQTEEVILPFRNPYDAVLEKYHRAIEEGWTREQCEIEGISPRMEAGADLTKVGYALLDLDGDGREELLVAEETVPHMDNIWDIYTTLEDGTPIQIWCDERDGYQCYLHEGNAIQIGMTTKEESEYTFYQLQGVQMVTLESLRYEDEDTVFHTDAEGNTRQVTSKEAQDIAYSRDNQKLDLTWLADIPDYLRDAETVERYTPILEKYKTALAYGWDRTMCVENGISMLTPIESEYEGLYYAISDLDGNGTKELVISEYPYREDTDTNFIDIYTILDGHVIQLMSLGDLDIRYLCEGGVVKDMTPQEQGTYDAYASFWEIREDQFAQTGSIYNKNGNWYHGFRGYEQITREEADEEVRSFKPAKLEFTRMDAHVEKESLTGYEEFDYIVNKYVTALNRNWTREHCEQNDISPDIFSETTIRNNLGWCLLDIDKNGVEELVISDGVHLFDLYVMMPHNGGPGHLVCANNGESYQLCENGVIQNHGFYSGTTAWRNYTLVDVDIIQRDIVFYDGELNQYYYGTDGKDLEPISKDKAGNLINGDRTLELTLIHFVEAEPFDPDEILYYQSLLELYQTALDEDWDPPTCLENGLSLMVAHCDEYYEELGYAMIDLDDNGTNELIITDGTNIYDLYTIIQDEIIGPMNLLSAMERINYYLTENNLIYHFGSGSASSNYQTIQRLNGLDLILIEGYFFDGKTDPENPWYYYDGETIGDSCGGLDVQAIIDSYKIVEIPFTPFE